MTATATATTAKASPTHMSLAAITRGPIDQPLRVLLYGVEGVGKSTFGAGAPSAVFLGAEDGTATLDVARMPSPTCWADVIDGVRALTVEQHEYKTLVIDTLDWMEPLLWAYICERDGKSSVEDYGFGKGYVAALDVWRELLAALDKLRAKKRMHAVLLAHSWIKQFKNPEGDDYDRYELKVNAKAGGLLKEWADCVLFANHETFARKDANKRVRGLSTGARIVYTTRTAAYDAKNRHDLPETLPLDWSAFWEATRARAVAPVADLAENIREAAAKLDADKGAKLLAALERDGADPKKLAALLNKANAAVSALPNKETA